MSAKRTLDAAPVQAIIRRHLDVLSLDEIAELMGVSKWAVKKTLARPRISLSSADSYCCFFGYHPIEIYGLDWLTA